MIEKTQSIFDFFKNFSPNFEVNVYIIGGAALMIKGLKSSTKDIDLVVRTEKEFKEFKRALINNGFASKKPGPEYNYFHLAEIFEKEEYRIDLFLDCVCAKLRLSDGIAKRAEVVYSSGKMNVFSCSNTDIFLFKSITDRPGDKDDCISLAKAGIDWNVFLSEVKEQKRILDLSIKNNEEIPLWFALIYESLKLFEARGVVVPQKILDESLNFFS